jgi:hypothetical protein
MSAEWQCADCGETARPNERTQAYLTHADTCPAGRAGDDQMALDREWFEQHPGAESYVRPRQPFEMAEVLPRPPFGWTWMVEVTYVADGVRMKRPFAIRVMR